MDLEFRQLISSLDGRKRRAAVRDTGLRRDQSDTAAGSDAGVIINSYRKG
jgi:hypothetical protein